MVECKTATVNYKSVRIHSVKAYRLKYVPRIHCIRKIILYIVTCLENNIELTIHVNVDLIIQLLIAQRWSLQIRLEMVYH